MRHAQRQLKHRRPSVKTHRHPFVLCEWGSDYRGPLTGWMQSFLLLGAGEPSMKPPSTCPLCSLVDGFMASRGSVCLALIKPAARVLVKKPRCCQSIVWGPSGLPECPNQSERKPSLAPTKSAEPTKNESFFIYFKCKTNSPIVSSGF